MKPVEKDPAEKLKPEEVALEHKLSVQTLAEWRSDGKGPPYHKLDPRNPKSPVRYVRSDVDKWFNQGRVEHNHAYSKKSA